MLISILLIILWCIIASSLGLIEGFYYHYKIKTDLVDHNEHEIFTTLRGIIYGTLVFIYMYLNPVDNSFLILLILPLIFPFFHDGFYYIGRNLIQRLDGIKGNANISYPRDFFSSSDTSSTKLEFSFTVRLIMLILGIIITILTQI